MIEDPTGTRLAVVGLGNMGLPMAARLAEAGYDVVGYDADPDAAARAEQGGITPAARAADAVADAAVVILMLPSSPIVTALMEDPEVLSRVAAGTLVIDMGSSEPLATQSLAGALAARGVRLIDAPVSGGVAGAVAGTLTIMVGAESSDFQAASGVLAVLGHAVHVGPVGAGDAVKALNNLLSATHLWVTSEAVLAGERFGVDPETLLSVVNSSSGRSGSSEAKWPRFVLPGTYDSGFALRLMLKDMKIAVDLCDRVGQSAALGHEAVQLWERAAGELPSTADHTEVARWLRTTSPAHTA